MNHGEFKFKNAIGNDIVYSINDVTLYQGQVFKCIKQTTKSPFQCPQCWQLTGMTVNTVTDLPPDKPLPGQIWTSKNGTSYVWFDDGNSFQWVET